jgi:GAF domain-containing protein
VPLAQAAREGTAIWLPDRAALQAAHPGMEVPAGQQAHAAVALAVSGQAFGALALSFAAPQAFPEEDRHDLLALAGHCALALKRVRLLEEAINDEPGQSTSELNQLNAFLESIWAGLGGAVAVPEPDLRVLVRNRGSEFLNLDIGLPLDKVLPALRASMGGKDGTQTILVEATNRRGKTVKVRVSCSPLVGDHADIHGVIPVVEERPDEDAAARPLSG